METDFSCGFLRRNEIERGKVSASGTSPAVELAVAQLLLLGRENQLNNSAHQS